MLKSIDTWGFLFRITLFEREIWRKRNDNAQWSFAVNNIDERNLRWLSYYRSPVNNRFHSLIVETYSAFMLIILTLKSRLFTWDWHYRTRGKWKSLKLKVCEWSEIEKRYLYTRKSMIQSKNNKLNAGKCIAQQNPMFHKNKNRLKVFISIEKK